MYRILTCVFILVLVSCQTREDRVSINSEESPEAAFALGQIKAAKDQSETQTTVAPIVFLLDTINFGEQDFSIDPGRKQVSIIAGGNRGLLYGGLEVAEQIELYGEVRPSNGKPDILQRGLKFNIPLDARTPSYDDSGDAAQKNIAVMWDWSFWEEYLDQMAIHRYNVLTLWNPHPFPSMIKLEEYPDVALDDVYKTTLIPEGYENEWGEPQLVTKNVMANLEKIKEISIDEKIEFWQKVMQHAKDRGIDIYWITWNICPNSVAPPVDPFYKTYNVDLPVITPGKHGITYQIDDQTTINYYRKSVAKFLETYPNVKGIGVTAGEHMPKDRNGYNRERWLWESYGAGILDLKKEQPGRTITFIHRVWNSNMDLILQYWKDYPDPFEVSFKYAKARLYSSPYLNFSKGHLEAMKKYGLKSWWNLRNDDIFVYRWGDPEYVHAFLDHFPNEETAGYHMGSDGYVWGREFISKDPNLSGELEINKHWYNFMLWGRLGYTMDLDKEFFIAKLEHHFQIGDAELLYETWKTASRIIPLVNVFHWRDWDYMWSVESCQAIPTVGGYRSLDDFISNPTLENSGILNPEQYANEVLQDNRSEKTSPMEVADSLDGFAAKTLIELKALRAVSEDPTYQVLIDDIEAQAMLGQYYATKIRAATHMAIYKIDNDPSEMSKIIAELETGKDYWRRYAEISTRNYKSQMLARTDSLDWYRTLSFLVEEIEEVKSKK